MAERPELGNVYGNLQAAIDATKGKAKAAIEDVERLADEREKALANADAAEEQQVTRDTERGKKKQAVRKQTKAAVAEESAALEQNERIVATETGAVDANTAAWRRNAAAKREAAAAGAEAGGKYPGAFGGTTTKPLGYTYAGERAAIDPTVYKPRKPLAPHPSISETDQRLLYEEALGRKPGPNVPIGVQVEREGRQVLETSSPETYAKYASRAGWIKAASKARKEEAKAALAEAKAAAAEEVAAEEAAVVARSSTPIESRALTPEQQYHQDLARTLEKRQDLGTAVGDLSPAVRATKAPAGGGGGRDGGNLPPVALGGAGGAGGGDGEGKIKAVSAAEKEAAATERDLNAVRAESNAILQRQLGAYASSSTALQRHGALTAEFIQALIRGEVTLKEFESQLGVTIGKFAGWAVAGGLVYGAYEGIKKLLDGVTQTQSGVEQLKRALGERVNVPAAEEGFRKLSAEVNVPIGGPEGSARAQFYAARVFHDQQQAQELAGTALRAFKLDEVNPQDAIKSFAALNVAFKSGPDALKEAFDQLDVGQLRFNARLNQTLPQVGRAAASFAAAGGTQKQLIDQIIQINRATGGGGGTGGGNPATALLREPANLTRPESEETLKRFGIDPKWARQHIGDFNQYVQELAGGRVQGQGQLSEADLQALSKAAGGGAGVGFRYLLPLFRLGQGNLPSEERAATENAKGSAEEDLKHKLSQLDEQFKKLGVDFEIFGSHVGSTGIEKTLADVVTGLNLVVKSAGLAIHPFAALGSTLSNLPTPIRDAIEAAALIGGLKLATRSRIGQRAAELAGESSVYLKTQGDPDAARKVRSALVTQNKDAQLLTKEKEQIDSQARSKARAVSLAATNVERTRLPQSEVEALGPIGTEDRDAYHKKLNAANASLTSAVDAQVANQQASNLIAEEQLANNKLIATLQGRRIALETKINAIRAYEAHGVGGGSPTTNPLIYPNKARALEEDQRLGRTAGPGGTGKVLPPLGGGAQAAERSAALGAEAETAALAAGAGAGLFVATDAKLKLLGNKFGEYGSKLKGMAGGLGNLFTNAGLLTRGIAAFAVVDVAAQATGGAGQAEQASSLLAGLQNPSSKNALEKKLEEARHQRGENVSESLYDVAQAFQHPVQGVESLLAPIGLGNEHPETFISDRKKQIRREARAKAALLRSGKLQLPGTIGGSEAEEGFQGGEEIHAHELGSSSQEAVEGSKKQIEAGLKLRLQQLKSFGGTAGDENIRYLARQLAALSHEYTQSGSQPAFEELAASNDSVIAGVIKIAQERLALAQKFYSSSREGAAALGRANSEIDTLFAGLHAGTKADREELHTSQKGLAQQRQDQKTNAGPPGFASPLGLFSEFPQGLQDHYPTDAKRRREDSEAIDKRQKETEEQAQRVKNRENESHEKEKEGQAVRAANDLSNFEARFARPTAEANLAGAGAGKVAKAEIALKLALQKERAAIEGFGKDKLNFAQLDALREAVVAATEAAANARSEARGRRTQLAIAGLPAGSPPSARLGLEAQKAREDEAEARARSIPKGLKPEARKAAEEGRQEKIEEAEIKNREAGKAIAENSISESKQLSQLSTQIAEARDEGNAAAQAADQAAGAAKAQAEALTPAEHLQATLDAIKATNAARKAALSALEGKEALVESTEPNVLEKDKTKIDYLKKRLPLATHDDKVRIHAELNNEVRKRQEDKATEQIDEIKFLEHTQRITQAQGVERLQKVLAELKRNHASTKSIRALESEIYDQQTQTGAEFAVGRIARQPTLYDAKTLTPGNPLHKALTDIPKVIAQHAQAVTGGPSAHISLESIHHPPQLHQTNYINVNVPGGSAGKVVAELERAFRVTTRSQMRSARLVG